MDNERKIIEKLDKLTDTLNEFKVGQAKRVTRLETKMNGILWTMGVVFASFIYTIRDLFK